ncbi:hypothetical protein [Flavobacterium sp. N1994]|uniref:hypothetical protein n=1 Tax=Flavobacterium sp. N1994 TaxID=2986827 RepID=UPI0022220CDC|nr:hypothetical protein [Flavobacterium sp. N1994]
MSKHLQEFKKLLTEKIKARIPIQTEWVKVSEVDWEAKTMTCIGENNGLEYFDVLLGLGSIVIKPKVDSLALVGSIHNGEAAFLISCEEMEGFELIDQSGFKLSLNNGQMMINGDDFGGIVNAVELKNQVDKNTLILQKIQEVFTNWNVVPNDGGAALKILSSQFRNLDRANLSNIQNTKIKHG